jgi:arylesterase/paraoxonase
LGVIVFTAAAGAGVLYFMSFLAGADIRREPFKGFCTPVSGILGAEDLQIDPLSRRVFITSFDRNAGEGEPRGGIFAFSIDDPLSDSWRDRTGGAPSRFEPVGLSFYEDSEVRRLFVANAAARSVEIYDVDSKGDLSLIETLGERRLTSPNDVVAVGPRAFYVTNDIEPGRDSFLGAAHYFFRAGSGRIMHFDGVSWRVAADGLRFASGIAASLDGKRIYVTETAAAGLNVYDRDLSTGTLSHAVLAPLGAAAGKINIDPTGALWIGAQPKTLLPPSKTASNRGSTVFGYDDLREVRSKPFSIFEDDGRRIAAATAASRLGRTLLISSQADDKFLLCELS